jgi:hypothetical protein
MSKNIVTISAICLAIALGGCSNLDQHQPVEGTVERVGVQQGNFSQAEERFIKLKDNKIVFVCMVQNVPTCAVLKPGDIVSLGYESNSQLNTDYSVYSATISGS